MNISFDFDGTLVNGPAVIVELALRHCNAEDNVFIVTSRRDKIFDNEMSFIGYIENKEVFELAQKLHIPKQNIHFTNQNLKLETLLKLNIDLHYEDDVIEVDDINRNSDGKCQALLINHKINY